jgi:hypothetical protein
VSDRVDYFAQAFGGFDPSRDPDAALKFVLNAIMMHDRLDGLSSILTDGHEIGALEGEPGWTLERRDSGLAGESSAYRNWPPGARFRAYVDPNQFHLGHSEAFAGSSVSSTNTSGMPLLPMSPGIPQTKKLHVQYLR